MIVNGNDVTLRLNEIVRLTHILQFDERYLRNSFYSKKNRKILRDLYFRMTMDKRSGQSNDYGFWILLKYYKNHEWHEDLEYVVLYTISDDTNAMVHMLDDDGSAYKTVIGIGDHTFDDTYGFDDFVLTLFHEIGHVFMDRKAADMIEEDYEKNTYEKFFTHSKRLDERLADLFSIICTGSLSMFVRHFQQVHEQMGEEFPSVKDKCLKEGYDRTHNFIRLFQKHPEMTRKYQIA